MEPCAFPPNWELMEVLREHPALSLAPRVSAQVVVAGDFRCFASGPNDVVIDEIYSIELRIPSTFPRDVPQVFERGGRISESFHHLENGELCLGSPTAVRAAINGAPTIRAFLANLVTPYLYGHAFHGRYGVMPFGELPHGAQGLEEHLLHFFRMPADTRVLLLLQLTGLRRREANKRPCPCGAARRLGRCHNTQVNAARRLLGRTWFRQHAALLQRQRELELKRQR